MRKRIFYKYIVSFASFFIVPLVLLSIFFQFIMYQNLNEEILTYNKNVLERIGDDIKQMHGQLLEVGNRIEFSTASADKIKDIDTQIEMLDLIQRENWDSSYVNKIYLIYKDSDSCFTSQGVYDKYNFFTKQLRLSEEDGNEFLDYLYQQTTAFYDVIEKKYTFTNQTIYKNQPIFVYPVDGYSGKLDAWVIMELRESKIDLAASSEKYNEGISVFNRANHLIISRGNIDYLTDDLELSLENNEIIISEINHQKVLIYTMKNPDLVLIEDINSPNLWLSVVSSKSWILKALAALLLLGCATAVYVAYSYYKPIQQLAQYMKQEDEVSITTDELTYIKDQYDSVNQIKESLTTEIEKQWPLVEARLVTRILHEGIHGIEEEDIVGKVFQERLGVGVHVVVLLTRKLYEVDSLVAFYKENKNKIEEVLEESYTVISSFLYDYDMIALIINCNSIENMHNIRIKEGLKTLFGCENSEIAFGNAYGDLEGIHVSFLEALATMKYQLLNPSKKIQINEAYETNVEFYSQKISQYQTECFLILNRCLDMPKQEEVDKAVKEVELNLKELPGQIALLCCYDIVSKLVSEVKSRKFILKEEQFLELTSFWTVDQFNKSLKNVLGCICKELSELKLDTQNKLINEIQEYLALNFKDSEMCLVKISEHFGYSSSYMSKIISQNLNQNFSELLSGHRLFYTKECLRNSDKPIAQIAQEAGYGNLSNFTRRFKASEHMTPGQYRIFYKNGEGTIDI